MPTTDDILPFFRLLGLPAALPRQQAQAEQMRALYAGAGFTPEQLQAAYPDAPFHGQFPGTGVPILGGILRGVGVTGQLLQTILGDAPTAPRPTEQLSQMMLINNMQQKARQQKGREAFEAAHPETREGLEAGGSMATAQRIVNPPAGSELSRYQKEHPEASLDDYERWKRSFKPAADTDPDKGAPTFEKDLDREARKRFPNDTTKQFEWKQAQRVETAVGKTAATTTARTTAAEAVKRTTLTNATKTMVEAAPTVSHFVDRIEKILDGIDTGPFASRWQEFTAGRIGEANKEFTRYRTNVDLLQTLLVRMHVGARGGQQMLDHFRNLIDAGTQSSENMRAALEEIRSYADELQARGAGTPAAPSTAQATQPPPASVEDDLRRQHPEWFPH